MRVVRWTLNYKFVGRNRYNLTKKRVMPFFKTDRSFRAMAGVHRTVIGQGEQFFANILGKCFKITAGEIPAPYAAAEQHIATYQEIISLIVKAKMRRRVARREDQLQVGIAE